MCLVSHASSSHCRALVCNKLVTLFSLALSCSLSLLLSLFVVFNDNRSNPNLRVEVLGKHAILMISVRSYLSLSLGS
jgi:hypothetical protein